MKRRIYLEVLACLFLCAGAANAQSPWARSKAGFYAQAGYHFIPRYNVLFGENNTDVVLAREVSEATLQLYGEYGLTRKMTLIASAPYRLMKRSEANPAFLGFKGRAGSLSGIGNVSLALKRQLLSGPLSLAATLRCDLPANRYDSETDLRLGYDAVTITPSLSAGMGFYRSYWFAYAGYGYRGNSYSHFIDAGFEAGAKLSPLWLIFFSQWVGPFDNGDISRPPSAFYTGLYTDQQGWLSIGMKGIWEINRFTGFVVSFAGAARAQNVPKSPGIGLAWYFKWD